MLTGVRIIRQRSSVRGVLRAAQTSLAEEHTFRENNGGDIFDVSEETHLHHVHTKHHRHVREGHKRLRFGHALESHAAHLAIILLVMLDLTAVFGEVMLTSVCGVKRHSGAAGQPERRLVVHAPVAVQDVEAQVWPAVPSLSSSTVQYTLHARSPARLLATLTPEEEAREARIEAWEKGLHWFSISILALLLLYQAALLYCFGWRYFTKVWYMLDVLVLVISLVLELTLSTDEVGFLSVLLVWRVIRIVHGFLLTEQEANHESVYYKAKLEAMKAHCTCGAAAAAPTRTSLPVEQQDSHVLQHDVSGVIDVGITPLAPPVHSPDAGIGPSTAGQARSPTFHADAIERRELHVARAQTPQPAHPATLQHGLS